MHFSRISAIAGLAALVAAAPNEIDRRQSSWNPYVYRLNISPFHHGFKFFMHLDKLKQY